MRLSKNNLVILGIVPIIFGIIIMYNFFSAIGILKPGGMTTYMIYYQLVVIGIAMFLGATIYWGIIVYYIYLLQDSRSCPTPPPRSPGRPGSKCTPTPRRGSASPTATW